jgi:hypothetical protein
MYHSLIWNTGRTSSEMIKILQALAKGFGLSYHHFSGDDEFVIYAITEEILPLLKIALIALKAGTEDEVDYNTIKCCDNEIIWGHNG